MLIHIFVVNCNKVLRKKELHLVSFSILKSVIFSNIFNFIQVFSLNYCGDTFKVFVMSIIRFAKTFDFA